VLKTLLSSSTPCGFLPWRVSDDGPGAQPHCPDRPSSETLHNSGSGTAREMEFVGRRVCRVVGVVGVSTNGRLDMAREGGYWEVDVAVVDASYVGTIEGAASIMTVFVNVAVRPALSVAT
jgi:hypothetical protein